LPFFYFCLFCGQPQAALDYRQSKYRLHEYPLYAKMLLKEWGHTAADAGIPCCGMSPIDKLSGDLLLENPNASYGASMPRGAWSGILPALRIFCEASPSFLAKPFLACASVS
jgi:hypothetical protein